MKRRMLAWLMVFVMLVSALPLTAAAGGHGGGQGGNGQGGNQPSQNKYNHIDVRVAGSLTIETKVNGVVTKQKTVSVTVSDVSATLNDMPLSFTEKEGEGDEHEWHCQGLSLNTTADVVVVTCKISGTASDGSLINLTITKTYSGETTLKALIEECPAHSGYDIDIETTDLTELFTVDVAVTKSWADDNNRDGIRPNSVQLQLYADGVAYGAPVTVSAENNWTATFENLPKYSSGETLVVYTVDEVAVPAGYTKSVDGYTVTNTHNPAQVTISGSKTWDDNNNQDGKRPESITINLLADGQKVDSKTVTGDNWTWEFTANKYRDQGVEIEYTVSEEAVTGYTSTVNGTNVTNTHNVEKTEFTAKKVWDDDDNRDGLRTEKVEVQLYANGEAYGKSVTLNEENQWTYTWTELDVNSAGTAIAYTVKEVEVPEGYKASVEGGTITNKHEVAKTSVSVTKVWDDAENQDGIRPATVQVQLYANGEPCGEAVTLNEEKWSHTWEDLNVKEAGKAIEYTVAEVEVPAGYEAKNTGDAEDGYTITNSYTPEVTSVTVTKAWNDADNQDGKRPASVTVILLADGVETGASVKLNEENEWTASFTDLDKYAAGEEIVYTVAENKVEGYTASVAYEGDTAIVTNSYTPETTSVQVVKAWDDGNNKDGIRPEAVTVRLYANNQKTDMTLELSAEGKWTGAFENLPVYEDGETINYAVKEENVAEGYTVASIVVDPDTGIVKITNFHDTAVTEVSVYKEWDDGDDQDGIRPESVTIVLYADGEKVDSAELSEANNWKHTFADLALNNNGKEITYTVKEVKVEGYTVAYKATEDGWKVVNTHEPEIKEVTVSKVWYDNKDASDLRPDSITVQLYKNGKAWGDKFQLSDANNWKKTFELPVCEDGEEIQWTVKEVKVPDWYIVTYHQDSLTIMNTIQSDGSAKTGDASNIWLWVGIMSVSAVAVVAVLVLSKKKKKA